MRLTTAGNWIRMTDGGAVAVGRQPTWVFSRCRVEFNVKRSGGN